MDLDLVPVQGKSDFVIFQNFLRLRLAFATHLAEHLDFDLIGISRFDFYRTAVRLDDEFASGFRFKRLGELVFNVACREHPCRRKQTDARQQTSNNLACFHIFLRLFLSQSLKAERHPGPETLHP